ncbi:MAG TPA: dUTP diphosphatase [Candidatus Saccharimonadales bacterium]|nr:dUTP diphosphatase [Candidatus Saccharimonadales bacterium]
MKIDIINKSHHPLPHYQTEHAAAMDAHAFLPGGPIELQPFERIAVPTGLFMAIPVGFEMQVRSRSGLSLKSGIVAVNSPGTIDADYRGELKILLTNISNEPYVIQDGDRIAQLVIAKHEIAQWVEVNELDATARGDGGLGGTGR